MKLKNCFPLFLSAILITSNCAAQKEGNVWYFGNYAGLDFNSGIPVAITNGALFTYDNSSTVSDTAGNILFYTNGISVWNSNHQIMSLGSNIGGSNTGGQSALIVKQPLSSTIYYIFIADAFGASGGLKYAMVDMSLQGGLGEVTLSNLVLHNPSTEKLCGIYNCGDNSAWLVTHKANSNEFCSYSITSSGLNTIPVISAVGSIHPAGQWGVVNNTAGQMTISKSGNKIACAKYQSGTIEIFDFNMITGAVSNPLIITGKTHAWGLEFSADETKLYLSQWFTSPITQYDISSNNLTQILSSATVVGNATGGGGYAAGFLQRGPDDKIYIARWAINFLAVINYPNAAGANCMFVDNGIALGTATSTAGLSRVVVSECLNTGITNYQTENNFSVYPNPNNGSFKIFSSKLFNRKSEIIVRNNLEQIVFSFDNDNHSKNELMLTLQLTPGIYFLEINQGDEHFFEKMVVL